MARAPALRLDRAGLVGALAQSRDRRAVRRDRLGRPARRGDALGGDAGRAHHARAGARVARRVPPRGRRGSPERPGPPRVRRHPRPVGHLVTAAACGLALTGYPMADPTFPDQWVSHSPEGGPASEHLTEIAAQATAARTARA